MFTKKLEESVIQAKSKGVMRDEYMYFQDILEDEKEQAREQGLAEGKLKTQKETARKMLIENCSLELIKKITELSEEEINSLR